MPGMQLKSFMSELGVTPPIEAASSSSGSRAS
jgi:hypothetical protein